MSWLLKVLKRSCYFGGCVAFAGTSLGIVWGVLDYLFIALPYSESLSSPERATYLCLAGKAPLVFGLLGAVLGAPIGGLAGLLRWSSRSLAETS